MSWRWYSHDIATLRLADVKYRVGHREHFAYVQKLKLVFKTRGRGLLYLNEDAASFLEDAAYGRLPAVSWIDPNFKDFNLIGSPPNDDHPPSDVIHGQELALLVYNALATGPQWDKTLLLVFYDEHGGFFDHVTPPENPPDDDPTTFTRYGVRVPAFVVSPWVKAGTDLAHALRPRHDPKDDPATLPSDRARPPVGPKRVHAPPRKGSFAPHQQTHRRRRRARRAPDTQRAATGAGPQRPRGLVRSRTSCARQEATRGSSRSATQGNDTQPDGSPIRDACSTPAPARAQAPFGHP